MQRPQCVDPSNIKRILENIESFVSGDPGGIRGQLRILGAKRRRILSASIPWNSGKLSSLGAQRRGELSDSIPATQKGSYIKQNPKYLVIQEEQRQAQTFRSHRRREGLSDSIPPTQKGSYIKQNPSYSGDPGGIRNRLSVLGAQRRRTLSRYDVHPEAQRRALQMKKHLVETKC